MWILRQVNNAKQMKSIKTNYGSLLLSFFFVLYYSFYFKALDLHDQIGESISSSGIIEGCIQDGPAIVDSLMRNAAK